MTNLWLLPRPLILASKSQARRALIAAAGLPFEVVESRIDERTVERQVPEAALRGPAVAAFLAREKSLDISSAYPDRLTLGADQTLALGDVLLTKPDSLEAAKRQLLAMAGRTHQLHAALCLSRNGEVVAEAVAHAQLSCRAFTAEFVDCYLALAGTTVLSSVGGYAIEGLGVHLFDKVEGEHSTILGLPMIDLLRLLRELGALER